MTPRILIAAALSFAALGTPLMAQDASAPDGTTAEEKAATASLNQQQAARLKAQADAESAEQARYDAALADYNAKVAEFEAATAKYEAQKARLASMSAKERIQWEKDTAACNAGDATRCMPQ